jgi:WD40 repeat protein
MSGSKGLALFDLSDLRVPRMVLSASDPARIHGARFAPDNKSLVTDDSNGLLKFWNLQTLRVALTLRFSDTPGGFLAFAPDGNLLVSSDATGVLRFWQAPSLDQIDKQRRQ